jgi:hypothetical protein
MGGMTMSWGVGHPGLLVLFGLVRLIVGAGVGLLVVYFGSYWGVSRALRESRATLPPPSG